MSQKTTFVLANLALAVGLRVSTAWGDVSGVVFEQDGVTPIPGAIVTLQATDVRTTSGEDGSYSLPIDSGTDLVIVGAKKRYFNQSVIVDAPASGVDISLDPVPQDDDPNYTLAQPESCGMCHPDQLTQWTGSRMSSAGLNTWVHDIYNGTGTPGGMGGFVYTRDSIFAETNPNSECASCHQPEVWIETPFTRQEGPQDPGYPSPATVHGVSCDICHKIADVDVTRINFPGIFPGAVTFTRPQGSAFHQVQYGVLGDADFTVPTLMRPSYQPQLVAETCAACHQDANDLDENHTYNGVISEPTYLEWVNSPYGDIESPLYATCVDCHMPPSGSTVVCNILSPPLERDPETIRHHTIEGTTPQFLENAVELAMHVERVGSAFEIQVEITNSLTGHHVPTGVTVRNMILLVEAWREEDGWPLTHTGDQVIHDLGGIGDPSEGYFAGLPGEFFAKVNHDADGNGPTFFTDAFGILFDNRIPALETNNTSYTFAVPGGGGTAHIRARLIYRRAFRFLVDAKQWTRDGHGNPLEDVSPPHYGHLMEMAEESMSFLAGDGDGDGDADLIDFAQFAACVTGPGHGISPACEVADLDNDGDVDCLDYGAFQLAFTGGP